MARRTCRLAGPVLLAALAGPASIANAQFTPQWRVGDWWKVELRYYDPPKVRGATLRYDVTGLAEVAGRQCYVLQETHPESPPPKGYPRSGQVYYVRTDSWVIVRQVTYSHRGREPRVDTTDCPLGMFGPFVGEPCLPRFPLRPDARGDTLFRVRRRHDFSSFMRDMTELADSIMVRPYLSVGDTEGQRVLRPLRETVFVYRSDLGRPLYPLRPDSACVLAGRNLQVWCDGLPWRVYEEYIAYGDARAPLVGQRSWLVAVGHDQR